MIVFITVLAIVLLLIWLSSNQNFESRCDDVNYIRIDSGLPGPCLGIIAGVHGNEPAAAKLLSNPDLLLKPKRGSIIVIPRANQCGLKNNVRENPSRFSFGYDLNRQFNEYGGVNEKSNQIVEIFKNCDLIIDFHEGWGWNIATRNGWGPVSLGSTIFSTKHPLAERVAHNAVKEINLSITDPNKKFVQLLDESCKIPSTLSCHYENQGRAQVVVETSGQNDVQPLYVRQEQVKKVIEVAKDQLGL